MGNKIVIIGKRSNLSKALNNSIKNSLVIASKDIKSLEITLKNEQKISIIYNTCFKSNLLYSNNNNPIEYSNYSFHYLSQFIDLCLKYQDKIESIIYSSSCAVYGENEFAKEDDNLKITNLYAALKASSEYLLKKYLDQKNINIVIARLFNMYGGNDNFSVISKVNYAIKNDTPFKLANNGNNFRDFINIKDVVEIYKIILNLNFKGSINISSGVGTPIKKIISIAEEINNKKLRILNDIREEVKSCIGCNRIIKRKLKFEKFINIEDFIIKEFKE